MSTREFGNDFYERALVLVENPPKVPTSVSLGVDLQAMSNWGKAVAEFLLDIRFLVQYQFYENRREVADVVEFLTQSLTTVSNRLYEAGDSAHRQIDYALSESYWHLLGESSDTEAANRHFIRSGKSPGQAECGARACGSLAARFYLAERYAFGVGVERNLSRSKSLFDGIDEIWDDDDTEESPEGDRIWAVSMLVRFKGEEDLETAHKMAAIVWSGGFYPAATTVALFEQRRGVSLVDEHQQVQDEDGENDDEDDSKVEGAESTLESELATLIGLVGLSKVKAQVQRLVAFENVQSMRRSRGLSCQSPSRHLVLAGNPGTGKTTVARILARIYHHLGVLSSGVLVETDRSGLVGGYMGQTAIKTSEVIEQATGGVLFIDEAYTLASEQDDAYGLEAINTLLKAMEDKRSELVVMAAGYTEQMETFLRSNPGLRSRFNTTIVFDDYSAEERANILSNCARDGDYDIDHEALDLARAFFELDLGSDQSAGNGRFVRNFYEALVDQHAARLDFSGSRITTKRLITITPEDVRAVAERFGHRLPVIVKETQSARAVRMQQMVGVLVGEDWPALQCANFDRPPMGEKW